MIGRSGLSGALLLALVGCVAGPAPSDHFYRLEAGAPTKTFERPPLSGTIEVRRFRADAVTAGRRIVLRRHGEPMLQPHTYHYWADVPTTALQVELVRYLREASVADRVVTSESRVPGDYVVTGRILRLERVVGNGRPRVDVAIEFALIRESSRDLVVLDTYREELEVPSDDVAAAATAFGRALNRIFAEFTEDAARR